MPNAGWRYAIVIFVLFAGLSNAPGQPPAKIGEAALLEAENQVSAKHNGANWQPGLPVLPLAVGDSVRTGLLSRAAVRLTDLSVLRMNEATTVEILPAEKLGGSEGLDVKSGAIYFFSRDRPRELRIQTPVATGALRGTEFQVAVGADGRTTVTMLNGEVELSNSHGSVVIRSGEEGLVERGQAPKKTAVIEALNTVQWCLYYPGVLDPSEIKLSPDGRTRLARSLQAYREGDVLGALKLCPAMGSSDGEDEKLYRAAMLLVVGQVDKAKAMLKETRGGGSERRALEMLIDAVTYQPASGESSSDVGPEARPNENAGSATPGKPTGPVDKNVVEEASEDANGSSASENLAEPQSASEWLARSYYEQSRGRLEKALEAAKRATDLSPSFGFAWTRVAELEFSFGRTRNSARALEKGTSLAPKNAAAFSLRGFVQSAQNDIASAIGSFEESMKLDGALGDAWLGRGLCLIRRGQDVEGRKDLQTATVLEPNRSIFRSYLGKAFSNVGSAPEAQMELKRAIELDPRDPTPWLYSAIEHKQENRYNEAIDDLEESIALNDNRRVYRSQFLLDQDQSIRGTNLAAIFLNDGMQDQSVREAVRAVEDDYSSAPAHLFLANSYNALRDPDRILLRYETAWFNELLLSNLLSPVGGGPLSQFVSEQEYSKMFQHDGFGISSLTEYFSYGEVREIGSQYGTFGNISYSVDTDYQYASGTRPNDWISRSETYAQLKLQVDPGDTLFLQTKFEDLSNGDVFQHYNQRDIDKTLDFHEVQDPALALAGWHRQWTPGQDTLVLVGRLANQQTISSQEANEAIVFRDVSPFTVGLDVALNLQPQDFTDPFSNPAVTRVLRRLVGRGEIHLLQTAPFNLNYASDFEAYTGEIQHIAIFGPDTVIVGGRFQSGDFETSDHLVPKTPAPQFDHPAAQQDFDVVLERINLYIYDIWRVARWLSVSGGLTYDHLEYPDNFRSVPVNDRQSNLDKASPKVGVILQPFSGTVFRGAYTRAISGASFDESVRLEPTQLAGFTQAYRSLLSESLIGSVAGSRYEFWGGSVEQKLPTRTFLGVEYDLLKQDLDRSIGTFDFLDSNSFGGDFPTEILPSSLAVKDNYREHILTASANQLLGDEWSLGARYQFIRSEFREQLPELENTAAKLGSGAPDVLLINADKQRRSNLHQLDLFALYNHRSGFFARADAIWYMQDNEFQVGPALAEPGDKFWQLNFIAGWRFYRNQCELACGLLNATGTDYHLDPLNPYMELPRTQTFYLRAKLTF